jgi:RNA polymerase sigma factor (TIGR02999 family)
MDRTGEVTRLLRLSQQGDEVAAQRLFSLMYGELRQVAGGAIKGQGEGQTLQPTALVHEAYLRLIGAAGGGFEDRQHFLRTAGRAMRSILVDHARARNTLKRGGDRASLSLDEIVAVLEESFPDLLELNEALARLAVIDAKLACLVELRFFAGLSNEETAQALGISRPTVERRWRVARTWLREALEDS